MNHYIFYCNVGKIFTIHNERDERAFTRVLTLYLSSTNISRALSCDARTFFWKQKHAVERERKMISVTTYWAATGAAAAAAAAALIVRSVPR